MLSSRRKYDCYTVVRDDKLNITSWRTEIRDGLPDGEPLDHVGLTPVEIYVEMEYDSSGWHNTHNVYLYPVKHNTRTAVYQGNQIAAESYGLSEFWPECETEIIDERVILTNGGATVVIDYWFFYQNYYIVTEG